MNDQEIEYMFSKKNKLTVTDVTRIINQNKLPLYRSGIAPSKRKRKASQHDEEIKAISETKKKIVLLSFVVMNNFFKNSGMILIFLL